MSHDHMGVNPGSVRREVMRARMANAKASLRRGMRRATRGPSAAPALSPTSFDLRTNARLTEPANQGATERCIAFAMGAVAEGRIAYRDTSTLQIPSTQAPDVDEAAFHVQVGAPTIIDPHRRAAEKNGILLAAPQIRVKLRFDHCRLVPPMKQMLLAHGPLFCAIRVFPNFANFTGAGVFVPVGKALKLAHAVCIIGWTGAQDPQPDCWIIRNSMGPTWGSGGYFLARFNDSNLNLENFAMFITNVTAVS